MGNRLNIATGQRFNMLTVIKELPINIRPSGQPERIFLCKCDCGNTTKIRLLHLIRDRIKSCGCLTTKSGKPKHGKSGTNLYKIWRGIITRTRPYHPERHLYFDRFIDVCEEWFNDFAEFEKFAIKNGYKYGLQIDRIDNNRGYYPNNCRFVHPIINVNNRNNTVKVIYKNKEYPFMILIRDKNLLPHFAAIKSRIKRGWSVEDAFDKPIRNGNYKRTRKES